MKPILGMIIAASLQLIFPEDKSASSFIDV